MHFCDKCGREVKRQDDARVLQSLVLGTSEPMQMSPRHILCSPSRAQYITVLPGRVQMTAPEERLKPPQDPQVRKQLQKIYTDMYLLMQAQSAVGATLH